MIAAAHLPEPHRSAAADSDVDGLEPTPEWAGDAISAERFGSPEVIRAALLLEQVGEFDAALTVARQTLRLDQLRHVLRMWRRQALMTERDPENHRQMLDIDPAARAQIRELPSAGIAAFAEAFEVLSLVPERCEPINADNPDGGVYQLAFGGAG